MKEVILSNSDVLNMLDELLKEKARFNWEEFYSERERNVPFFIHFPDENLVEYFEEKKIHAGKVLELGCGHGRNAIYFAERGCAVDAVDSSKQALEWAKEQAEIKNMNINFIHKNIFDLTIEEESYDIVYDSGCFHHIAPHRRMSYIELVKKALKPNGAFAINCFVEGGELGGAKITDWDVYRLQSLQGGLGFTEEKLLTIFKEFEAIQIRKMKEKTQENKVFGVSGLWTALFRKKVN